MVHIRPLLGQYQYQDMGWLGIIQTVNLLAGSYRRRALKLSVEVPPWGLYLFSGTTRQLSIVILLCSDKTRQLRVGIVSCEAKPS